MATMIAPRMTRTQTECSFESPVIDSIPAIQSNWTQAERAKRAALGRLQQEKLLRMLGVRTCLL